MALEDYPSPSTPWRRKNPGVNGTGGMDTKKSGAQFGKVAVIVPCDPQTRAEACFSTRPWIV
jgi:hypothetical protein